MDLKPPRSLALAILRKIRDWQQGELALAAGVAEDTVSKWERGRKAPDPETLERLAAVMGQPPALVRQVLGWIAASQVETAPGAAGGLEEAQRRRIDELAEQSGAAWADLTRSFLTGLAARKAAEEGRYEPFKTSSLFDSTAEHPQWLGEEPERLQRLMPV